MRIDQNAFYRGAVQRICGSLDIHRSTKDCFHYLKRFLPLDSMDLTRYLPDLNVFEAIADYPSEQSPYSHGIISVPKGSEKHWADEWYKLGPIKITNRPEEDPDLREMCRVLGKDLDFSMLQMRLELEGNRVGSLGLFAGGTDRYTEEHGEWIKCLHEPFVIAMANALKYEEVLRLKDMLVDENRLLYRQLSELADTEIIGADFGLKDVMKLVRQVAPLDSPVLLTGETGAGKGVIANAIHLGSARRKNPFISVNCGAIPDTLVDSELFGHEKGAFTGTISQKRGRFERADKGTIFLDEIGELPPQAQVRMLNVLQNREIERVGGTRSIPVDIRIISATNRNLEEMMRSGRFREDLWFRLNVFPIMIPPLRRRKDDIPALVHHFIDRKTVELKIEEKPVLATGAMDRLIEYDWPGNVRELVNIVERALIKHHGGVLTFDDLCRSPMRERLAAKDPVKVREILSLDDMNSRYIRHVLNVAEGKVHGPGGAADLLHINPSTLRKRMDKLDIPYKRSSKRDRGRF